MEDSVRLKVVIHLIGERAFIAVQEKDTDPVMEAVTAGTLEEALGAVAGVVARARERWATSPRNPKYEGPPPPPAPATVLPARREPARALTPPQTSRMF